MDDLKFAGLKVAYADGFLDWQLGEEHPINPIRTLVLKEKLKRLREVGMCEVLEDWARAGEIQRGKWLRAAQTIQPDRVQKLQSELAEEVWESELLMFGATFELVDRLIRDRAFEGKHGVYFNPAGGELTGQHEGVEVLNDLAWACLRLRDAGYTVAYLDWDAHHSNETEALLKDTGVLSISIHDLTTAATTYSDPDGAGFINYGLSAEGDSLEFVDAVGQAADKLAELGIDVLVLNAGADGLEVDESTGMAWSTDAMAVAGKIIGDLAGELDASVLVGGGGGELPLDETPDTWYNVVGVMGSAMAGADLLRVQRSLGAEL